MVFDHPHLFAWFQSISVSLIYDIASILAFEVRFRGEHAVGDGGPYRELFNDIGRELQAVNTATDISATISNVEGLYALPLFIQCPNKQVGFGENRDKVVPRPKSNSSLVSGVVGME